jgi:hypothetical protein
MTRHPRDAGDRRLAEQERAENRRDEDHTEDDTSRQTGHWIEEGGSANRRADFDDLEVFAPTRGARRNGETSTTGNAGGLEPGSDANR